jgi:hypothetical protein
MVVRNLALCLILALLLGSPAAPQAAKSEDTMPIVMTLTGMR